MPLAIFQDAQHLVCLPIPGTDYEICLGLNVLGIAAAIFALTVAAATAYSHWGFRRQRSHFIAQRDELPALTCRGQYGDEPHAPITMIREGDVARCPTCGHTLIDSPY